MLAGSLPANPSLEQLRKQAKDLRDRVRTGHPKFTGIVREAVPRLAGLPDTPHAWARFTLAHAQLVVARCCGFASWRRLRGYLALVETYRRSPHRQPVGADGDLAHAFLQLACLSGRSSLVAGAGGDADHVARPARARELLAAHPDLASATIYTAAAVGDVTTARALLAADPASANREGGPYRWPPLLYLALSRLDSAAPGHSTLEVARLLMAHGADPNAGFLSDGEPPPVTALSGAFHGHRDPVNQPAPADGLALARLLLDGGANPNDPRAVDNACGYPYDDDGLELLLEYGLGRPGAADPWRTRLGPRPGLSSPAELVQEELRIAAERNLIGRTRLLLRRCTEIGIDVDTTGHGHHHDRTAHDLAVLAGNTEVADLLAAAGARRRPRNAVDQFVAACLRADRATAERLLAADPALVERAGGTAWPTPLHQAAVLHRPDAVRLLVSVGFPVDDRRGWPLHTAAVCGRLDIVKLLIELGGDPGVPSVDDSPGQFAPPDSTALGWARYSGQHDVVAYLAATLEEPCPR